MSVLDDLKAAVKAAHDTLLDAESALEAFNDSPEQHQYETMEQAESVVEDYLLRKARDACEGSYCCGLDAYTQEFIVAGVRYIGTLTVEYNRHDKTYYYVDESDFSVLPK